MRRLRLVFAATSALALSLPLLAQSYEVLHTFTGAFASWIYELVARNITGGCGNGNYCPADPATRGQMAVFVVKTFSLQ